MSYTLELIEKLPDVLPRIQTVQPNYQSQGKRADQYYLAKLALYYSQLHPNDVKLIQDQRFQQYYLLSNQELAEKAWLILGNLFSSPTRISLINQILNYRYNPKVKNLLYSNITGISHLLPSEIIRLIGSYLPSEILKQFACWLAGSKVGEIFKLIGKTSYDLLIDGNPEEIIWRINYKHLTDETLEEAVQYLITNRKEKSLFIAAAETNNLVLVQYLIAEFGYQHDPNILLAPARKGNLPLVQLLVEQGADPKDGRVLTEAALSGRLDLIQYLETQGAVLRIHSLIIDAAQSGSIPLAQDLINRGALLDNPEILSNAVMHSHLPLVQFLAGQQANVRLGNLLVIAIRNLDYPMINYLVTQGNNINNPVALKTALQRHNQELIIYLVRRGANFRLVAPE